MTNRVVIDASGLRVSRAGFDVLTASKVQLLFSSEWHNQKLWTKGSVFTAPLETKVVNYGKTFAVLPMIELNGNFNYYSDAAYLNSFVSSQVVVGTSSMSLYGGSSDLSTGVFWNYVIWDYEA